GVQTCALPIFPIPVQYTTDECLTASPKISFIATIKIIAIAMFIMNASKKGIPILKDLPTNEPIAIGSAVTVVNKNQVRKPNPAKNKGVKIIIPSGML